MKILVIGAHILGETGLTMLRGLKDDIEIIREVEELQEKSMKINLPITNPYPVDIITELKDLIIDDFKPSDYIAGKRLPKRRKRK